MPLKGEWPIEIDGLVTGAKVWTLAQLADLPQVIRAIDIHCVTRWSRPAMEFRGVRLLDLLPPESISPDCRFVSFVAQSERGHSTSVTLDVVQSTDPLLATHAEGEPLSVEHGGPLRVVIPGRYFYKSLKWLRRIEILKQDRLGYWESQAGYHNGADPWREERFLAADLDIRRVRELVSSRDFRKLDLRGLIASGLDLRRLNAAGSKLRDAHFEGAILRDACFDGANLSGAHLQGADLRGASFRQDSSGTAADLEGADFRGSDLRGCTFRHASLFGSTLGPTDDGREMRVDATTTFDEVTLSTLDATPLQRLHLDRATCV